VLVVCRAHSPDDGSEDFTRNPWRGSGGDGVINILRELLAVRELLESIAEKASEYAVEDQLPEIAEMQALERKAFEKMNIWWGKT
jgi:hypothetical protein